MYGAQRFLPLAGLAGWLILATVSGPTEAHAQNLEVGPFRILPSLDLTGEYNDNVDLEPSDKKSDFITTISPGIVIELPARRYALRLGYRADILRYAERSELDTVNHSAAFNGRIAFPWGLAVTLSDGFTRAFDFPGFPVPEITRRVERNENVLKLNTEYTIGERISLGLTYGWLLIDYLDDPEFEQLDRQEHQVGLIVFYRILPKTSLLGEYDYQVIRYDVETDRDSNSNKFKVGIRGDLTAKTSVTLKLGAEIKDYEDPAQDDWTGPIAEVEALWKYRAPSELRIFGGRANVESVSEGANFYVATYGGVEVRHHLTSRLILGVSGLIGVNDYPDPVTVGTKTDERLDFFYQFNASLRYQFRRWLSAQIGYAYLRRDSNFGEFEYTNNRVTVSLRLTY